MQKKKLPWKAEQVLDNIEATGKLSAMNAIESVTRAPAAAQTERPARLGFGKKTLLVLGAAASFHLAFMFEFLTGFVLIYAFCLICLGANSTPRSAFRTGFAVGFLSFAPHLAWFWHLFGPTSICLWAVLAFFTGLFTSLLSATSGRFGSRFLLQKQGQIPLDAWLAPACTAASAVALLIMILPVRRKPAASPA